VCVGWLWTDSAAAIHNIKDRHSQADHRVHDCILTHESVQNFICRNEDDLSRTILRGFLRIRPFKLKTVIHRKATPGKLL